MKKKIIIDTDTASDDAVALLMALRDPNIEVVAITTVSGNMPVEISTYNARMSAEYAGTYVPPIYPGASHPLVAEADGRHAFTTHGNDGMGDLGTLKKPTIPEQDKFAVDAILDIIEEGDGDIEIVTLGPLTNIAMAILQNPEVMKKVPHITMMGGAAFGGNITPTAEYNIWVDAEAADLVCDFDIPFTMSTIEACYNSAWFGQEEMDYLMGTNSELAILTVECNRTMTEKMKEMTGVASFGLPDPTAIAILAHPEMITGSFDAYTRVETKGSELTYGMTISDKRTGEMEQTMMKKNSKIVYELDRNMFLDYMYKLIV